jgi:CRP-like cAMP-binding protein
MRLHELKTQALRHVVLGTLPDLGRAFGIYGYLVRAQPSDLDARMKIADLLVATGMHDLARRVYAAIVFYDLQLGRPLHAVVCAHALSQLGEPLGSLFQPVAHRYASDSPNIVAAGKGLGARLAPPDPEADVGAPQLEEINDAVTLRSYVEMVAGLAASTSDLGSLPERYPPLPLLSELPSDAFLRMLATSIVRRVPAGMALVREGEPGTSFFMIASGHVRVVQRNIATQLGASGQHELGRLGEGAIFGEMALVSAQPRAATVEAVTEVDVIELSCAALRQLASEIPKVAEAVDRFVRDRLLKNLLQTSPLFRPFSPEQRVDLARRFTGHEVAAGTDLIRQGDAPRGLFVVLAGELEVVHGEEPFVKTVAILRTGDLFGEISLLKDAPASATVRASTPAAVLFLAREYFDRLVAALPEMRKFFEALSEERLKALAPPPADDPFLPPDDLLV